MCWGDAESTFHASELGNARGEAGRQVSTARLSWLLCERCRAGRLDLILLHSWGGAYGKFFQRFLFPLSKPGEGADPAHGSDMQHGTAGMDWRKAAAC